MAEAKLMNQKARWTKMRTLELGMTKTQRGTIEGLIVLFNLLFNSKL